MTDEQAVSELPERRAFAGAGERQREFGGTPMNIYVSGTPLPDHQPLLIFQHIRKTAGTALRQVIEKNYKGEGNQLLYLGVFRRNKPGMSLIDWYWSFYGQLTAEERARLICVASHSANYLIPILDRPFRAFTILRDPIDRVLSRYYFFGRPRDYTLKDFYEAALQGVRIAEVRGGVAGSEAGEGEEDDSDDESPNFASNRAAFFNGMARSLLEPHYDTTELAFTRGPSDDANVWRSRLFRLLSDHYTVGLQEHFPESVRLFGRTFGWKRLETPEVRVNPERPREVELDLETYELLRDCNWLDVELHRHYSEVLAAERGGVSVRGYRVEGVEGRPGVDAEAAPRREDSLAMRIRIGALEERAQALEQELAAATGRLHRPALPPTAVTPTHANGGGPSDLHLIQRKPKLRSKEERGKRERSPKGSKLQKAPKERKEPKPPKDAADGNGSAAD